MACFIAMGLFFFFPPSASSFLQRNLFNFAQITPARKKRKKKKSPRLINKIRARRVYGVVVEVCTYEASGKLILGKSSMLKPTKRGRHKYCAAKGTTRSEAGHVPFFFPLPSPFSTATLVFSLSFPFSFDFAASSVPRIFF